MKTGRWIAIAALLLLPILIALLAHTPERSREPAPGAGESAVRERAAIAVAEPGSYPGIRMLHRSVNPEDDLKILDQLFQHYQIMVKDRSGNPVGSNREITRALAGKNRARLVWIPSNHASVVSGELVDRWGTPYFFHALGKRRMEIRSAGPDRRMWTDDDLVRTPPASTAGHQSAGL